MIVAGGSYLEICAVPSTRKLFGSGSRAAAAVGQLSPNSELHTYAHSNLTADVQRSMGAFGVLAHIQEIPEQISFSYFHPLSIPRQHPTLPKRHESLRVQGDTVLRFSFVEGDAIVEAKRVVYDPQTGQVPTPYRDNGSTAESLAIVLNEKEAKLWTGLDVADAGHSILGREAADVVVIKCGVRGAVVCTPRNEPVRVPPFHSDNVLKIGSGDVFSAIFAHFWGEKEIAPAEAASMASRAVSAFVDGHRLPITEGMIAEACTSIALNEPAKMVYLAGPFFDIGQIWRIHEARDLLESLGVPVFSPLHDVGIGRSVHELASEDIEGLKRCSAVLAILDGADPGTVFEVGYARALNLPVVLLSESVDSLHLTMFAGSDCTLTSDFGTAIYLTAWAALT